MQTVFVSTEISTHVFNLQNFLHVYGTMSILLEVGLMYAVKMMMSKKKFISTLREAVYQPKLTMFSVLSKNYQQNRNKSLELNFVRNSTMTLRF